MQSKACCLISEPTESTALKGCIKSKSYRGTLMPTRLVLACAAMGLQNATLNAGPQ